LSTPTLSIITVAYNSADDLLRRWAAFDRSVEWIVVDNDSSDGSADVAESLGATVIRRPDNRGFSYANNEGAARATGEVLVFCNPDIEVDVNSLHALAAEAMDRGAIVAPQLLNADGTKQENGRGAPYPWRKVAHMFLPSVSRRGRYALIPAGDESRRVVWVMGAALAMTRTTFEKVGGWNDRFFVYYEDSDLGLRALRHDVPTFVIGRIRWVHGWARATKSKPSRAAWRMELTSAVTFYRIHWYCLFPVSRLARQMRSIERSAPEVESA
jgi:N-acetylglucosaminyl-diphospho-decaprenol L-rhamnosyltransferase